eukprot:NODE_8139_length_226_cov_20.203390_g8056_i0.p1 GENE.NODE_8139_length_226_cov_20.203390_g8056_i0~~NODE_8139_length_226_cov_20.203390_g8056_i0.p1  ORF type:complete len:69 (+),score=12.40 NODE_8139_length_226_cov_20.203390_g8056_i0:31-207(+)
MGVSGLRWWLLVRSFHFAASLIKLLCYYLYFFFYLPGNGEKYTSCLACICGNPSIQLM